MPEETAVDSAGIGELMLGVAAVEASGVSRAEEDTTAEEAGPEGLPPYPPPTGYPAELVAAEGVAVDSAGTGVLMLGVAMVEASGVSRAEEETTAEEAGPEGLPP